MRRAIVTIQPRGASGYDRRRQTRTLLLERETEDLFVDKKRRQETFGGL